jgi:hypothetical protein
MGYSNPSHHESMIENTAKSRHTPRKRVSSRPRLFDFITDASEYWIARFPRAMTAGGGAFAQQ